MAEINARYGARSSAYFGLRRADVLTCSYAGQTVDLVTIELASPRGI